MPKTQYEPVGGWPDLHDRAIKEVVNPWHGIRKNAVLTKEQAESLTRIVTRPHQLKLPFSTALFHAAADAIAEHPKAASELLRSVGEWAQRQRKTKRGRVMATLDALFALGRRNDITIADVNATAMREGICLRDVDPKYIKDRIGEMRKMVAEINAPKMTPAQIDALSLKTSLGNKP